MYTLYYSPGACSMAVHVVLNELGVPFTLENVSLSEGKNRTPEFLKINPRGQVPVLAEDGKAIREASAILLHLVEKHNSPLLLTNEPERTSMLEWLMFCSATLHPAYSRVFFLNRAVKDETEKKNLTEFSFKVINKLWVEVEERLEGNAYLAGDKISTADILLTVIANWSRNFPEIVIGDKTRKLFGKVIALPSYQKALATEQVEYKVAA